MEQALMFAYRPLNDDADARYRYADHEESPT
jgi:hypothetical protein